VACLRGACGLVGAIYSCFLVGKSYREEAVVSDIFFSFHGLARGGTGLLFSFPFKDLYAGGGAMYRDRIAFYIFVKDQIAFYIFV
jgi:hypothetical protein